MEKELISIQQAMRELNISAVGLDNNIKKKGFKKHYNGRQAFITIEDYNVIKKTVEMNGRVKKIKDKDNEDFELVKRKEELEKENENLKNEIQALSIKIESNYNATIDLKKDKEDLKVLLEQSNNNLVAAQKLLQNEQELHRQEKARRIELEERLKSTSYLLESSKVEQEIAVSKIDEATEKIDKINKVKCELENKLLEERANKEIVIEELNNYKNRSFIKKLKDLFV